MSLQYIIDGYNLINHPLFKKLAANKFTEPRIALLEAIKRNKLCGSLNNRVTVVFDGYSGISDKNIETDIRVVFSRNESADERIRRIVENFGNPKNLIVISDDNEIKFFARAVGAKAVSVEDFFGAKLNSQVKKRVNEDLELNFSQKHKITEELKKLWLK